ncbi:hypothetical protein B4U79_13977, partial [Dinothrombium tinctorium]
MSKVLEYFLNDEIENHLTSNKILSDNQFGFQKNKSTRDALIKL